METAGWFNCKFLGNIMISILRRSLENFYYLATQILDQDFDDI